VSRRQWVVLLAITIPITIAVVGSYVAALIKVFTGGCS
jgi:hypothetical protein